MIFFFLLVLMMKQKTKTKKTAGSVRDIDFHPTLPFIATPSLDRFVRVFDITTRKMKLRFYMKQVLTTCLFSEEGDLSKEIYLQKKLERQIAELRARGEEVPSELVSVKDEPEDDWDSLPVIEDTSDAEVDDEDEEDDDEEEDEDQDDSDDEDEDEQEGEDADDSDEIVEDSDDDDEDDEDEEDDSEEEESDEEEEEEIEQPPPRRAVSKSHQPPAKRPRH